MRISLRLRAGLMASALILTGFGPVMADTPWLATPDSIAGSLRAGSRDVPVRPGDETVLSLRNLTPGTSIQVMRGTQLLTPAPLKADDKGELSVPISVPADAQTGNHPLTVIAADPPGVMLVNLKLSEVIAPLNEAAFALQAVPAGERTYQTGLSADGKLFVASARGKGQESSLMRFDAATMTKEAEATLPAAADPKDGLIDVFGPRVDDANGRVWAMNTLDDTLTVFDAKTLAVVKAFPAGTVRHPRDLLIDSAGGRAYASTGLGDTVTVFDTKTMEQTGTLRFSAKEGRAHFASMSLAFDPGNGRLWSVSRETPYVGWVDTRSGESGSFEVAGLKGGSGIAVDPASGKVWIAAQDSNNVVLLDKDGKVLADTKVGAGAVSVAWNPKTRQAFAATRAGGTVAVLDEAGTLVANLPLGDLPNEVTAGPDGAVYATAMFGPPGDNDQTGTVTRITAKP